MTDLRKTAQALVDKWDNFHGSRNPSLFPTTKELIDELRQALAQPVDAVNISQECVDETAKCKRDWVGLSSLDKTFLRTAYAQLRPLYHDKKEDVSVAAEVVTDWDGFFAAIEAKLKEKNL